VVPYGSRGVLPGMEIHCRISQPGFGNCMID
jgi:hypothetical protein